MQKDVVERQVTFGLHNVREDSGEGLLVSFARHVKDVVQNERRSDLVPSDVLEEERRNGFEVGVVSGVVEAPVDDSHLVIDEKGHEGWQELQDQIIFLAEGKRTENAQNRCKIILRHVKSND